MPYTPCCEQLTHLYLQESLNLALRHCLLGVLIIAEVSKSIHGADLLRHFGLFVNMQRHQLSDSQTCLHVQGVFSAISSPSPPRIPALPTSLCCQSFLLSLEFAHQTTQSGMMSLTSLTSQAHWYQLGPDALRKTVSAWPSKSFNICFSLASSDPILVPGLPHFTWPKKTPGDW